MAPLRRARSIIRPARLLVSTPGRRWFVGGLVILGLTALFVAHANLAHMGQSFLQADRRWVAVSVGLMLVSLVLRSAALKVIVDALGGVRARLSDAFSATSIGLLANSVIPIRVGTVLAPYTLYVLLRRRGTAVPFATALGVALTERLFAIATFAALSLLFVSSLAMPAWAVQVLIAVAAIAATFLVGGIVLERRRRKLAVAGDDSRIGQAGSAGAKPVFNGLWRHVPELVDSQRIMGKPWSALLVAAVQAIAWLIQLAAAWAALQAFHLGGAGLRGAALVLVLTNLIGLVPITPATSAPSRQPPWRRSPSRAWRPARPSPTLSACRPCSSPWRSPPDWPRSASRTSRSPICAAGAARPHRCSIAAKRLRPPEPRAASSPEGFRAASDAGHLLEALHRVDADAEQVGDAELGHHRVGLARVQVGVVEDPSQALLAPDLLHRVAVAEVADGEQPSLSAT